MLHVVVPACQDSPVSKSVAFIHADEKFVGKRVPLWVVATFLGIFVARCMIYKKLRGDLAAQVWCERLAF